MLFYIIIFVSSSLFAFLYSKTESRNLAFIFKWTSFLILFLPLALRDDIGTDYKSYIWYITNGGYKEKFEIGWIIFTEIILALNLDIQWFFVIPAFLSLLIIFNFTEKKYAWIFIIGYILTLYLPSYSAIRQEFAMVILLLSIKFFIKNNIKLFFLFAFVACAFHSSILLALICVLFCFGTIKFPNKTLNILFLIIIFLLYFAKPADFFMTYLVPLTPYANYEAYASYNATTENPLNGFLFRFTILYLILLFINSPAKNEYAKVKLYNIVCLFIFSLSISTVLYMGLMAFNRLVYLFNMVFPIVLLYIYMNNEKNTKIHIAIILFFLTIFYIYTLHNGYITKTGIGIIPYNSILEK